MSKATPKAEQDTILAAFERAAGEEVRVVWSEYGGRRFLTIRLFWRPENQTNGDFWPTKRGVTIRPSELGKLKAAIERAMEIHDRQLLNSPLPPEDREF